MKKSPLSRISKINILLLTLTFVSMFAFFATKAFFTASESSQENTFVSGTLELNIIQDTVLSVSNWMPGDTHTLAFTVRNFGSLPVYIKGYLAGEWNYPGLDPNMVEIISAEVLLADVWVQLTEGDLLIGEEFFFSDNGMEDMLTVIQPQQEIPVHMVIGLKGDTPDEYQDQLFAASLHLAGRQVTAGSDWPVTY